jgi:hypothetical protein
MDSCLLVEWARTPPRCEPQRAVDWDFLASTLVNGQMRDPSLDLDVSAPDSRVRVLVIRAPEDWSIAKECWRLARLHDYSSWQRTAG